MHNRYAHPRGDGRKDDDEHGENDEQCSWVREDVPGSLNGSEKTVQERVLGDDFDFFASCSFHAFSHTVICATAQAVVRVAHYSRDRSL